jgi:hypothetical protein
MRRWLVPVVGLVVWLEGEGGDDLIRGGPGDDTAWGGPAVDDCTAESTFDC